MNKAIINTTRIYDSLFSFALGISVVYMLEYPILHRPDYTRIIWVTGFCILTLCYFVKANKLHYYDLIPISIIFVIIIIHLALGGYENQDRIISGLLFISFFFGINIVKHIKPSKKLFDCIYFTSVGLILLFVIYSFTSIATKFNHAGTITNGIYYTFNLDNANAAAIYLLYWLCIVLINIPYRKMPILNCGLVVADVYLIYRTNSRAVLAAAAVTIGIALICWACKRIKRIPRIAIIAAWIFPIVFVSGYLALYRSGIEQVVILGKELFSGRQNVFVEFIDLLDSPFHYIFGNYNASGFANAHNAPLAMFTTVGLIGAMIIQCNLLLCVMHINKSTWASKLSVASLIGLFIHSSAESSTFMGGFPGVIFMISIIMIANYTGRRST